MPYITSTERLGIEKGLEQGIEKGLEKGRAESLKVVLEARFGALSKNLADSLEHLGSDRFEELLPWAATATSLEEFLAKWGPQK